MDIKEKQAFDEYFQEKYPELYKDVFNEDGDERAIIGYSFALSAWQARAKAQAVPEQDLQIWATSNLTWKEVAFRALSCKVLKTTQNWVHVKNIASVGSTTASLICEKLGVNPDGTKFDLIKPQEQGHA